MDPTWSQDGFLLKRCHNLFEIVWNLDPCPVRNRNPEWAQLSASYLLCWGWIRLSFCHVSSGISRFWKPVLQPLKELKQREKPTNKKTQYPTIVTTSVSRACRSHTFLGGLLHNSVVLVGDQGQLQSQVYVWGPPLSQDMWFMCQQKKHGLQIAKKNSESAGLSSSSSTFSAKMAHKMGHTIQLRDIPLVVSKQKLPIAHKKKPRHSTPAGGMNFRGNIREWGEVTWGLGDHRM